MIPCFGKKKKDIFKQNVSNNFSILTYQEYTEQKIWAPVIFLPELWAIMGSKFS